MGVGLGCIRGKGEGQTPVEDVPWDHEEERERDREVVDGDHGVEEEQEGDVCSRSGAMGVGALGIGR